ncbi:MAG: hypothetical protein U0174_28270 [Polyangiaceae bacterium]
MTVGLPFCAFKVLTGLVLIDLPPFAWLGYPLVVLGAVDALLNSTNLASLLVLRRRTSGVCLSDVLVAKLTKTKGRGDLGLAIDVFVSFVLVAVVIGFHLLRRMPAWALSVWDTAVVLNVLGAGIGRLLAALRQRSEPQGG